MLKLVIVEDEETIRDCLVNLFPWGEIGIDPCAVFSNGRDALQYLLEHPADILITDIKLPLLDGTQLAQELRNHNSEIQIIFLTAYRDFEYARLGLRCGVSDFLLKPVKYNELLLAVLRIKDTLCQETDAQPERESSYYEQVIRNAKQYIHTHLQSVTLEDTAVAVHLSSSYFSRLFKEKTGQTFSDYVTKHKMRRAAEQLRTGEYRTYEVAAALGYDNPKNFSRAFKQFYGVSPREYRDGAAAQEEQG